MLPDITILYLKLIVRNDSACLILFFSFLMEVNVRVV